MSSPPSAFPEPEMQRLEKEELLSRRRGKERWRRGKEANGQLEQLREEVAELEASGGATARMLAEKEKEAVRLEQELDLLRRGPGRDEARQLCSFNDKFGSLCLQVSLI